MKFGELKSIGHNIADSLASGIGLMIGVYDTNIFAEAAKSPEGHITVDFLTGTTSGGRPSPSLAKAITLYAGVLEELCQSHGGSSDAFSELTVRFSRDAKGKRFVVTVCDQNGRCSTDAYLGTPGKRVT